MQIEQVRRLWQASGHVVGGHGPRGLVQRARFVRRAVKHRRHIAPLLDAAADSLLGLTVAQLPATLGFFEAPYLCSTWDAPRRISEFVADIAAAERLTGLLDFAPDRQVDLMPLDHLGPDFWLVLDKPVWFHREGAATINLFRGGLRLFTIAFSLRARDEGLVATIGGIQGRQIEGALDLYRDMTKDSAGMRPRDLLIELFRAFCRALGVVRILAVSDAARHHRSRYFGAQADKLGLDYDAVWTDRGGTRVDESFFALPVARLDRAAEDIPAKKRSLYRKRYELLDLLEERLRRALGAVSAHPVSRGD